MSSGGIVKRLNIQVGVFGEFSAEILCDLIGYLLEDELINGFNYEKKPKPKNFKMFTRIICSWDVFSSNAAILEKIVTTRNGNKREIFLFIDEKQLCAQNIDIPDWVNCLCYVKAMGASISLYHKDCFHHNKT